MPLRVTCRAPSTPLVTPSEAVSNLLMVLVTSATLLDRRLTFLQVLLDKLDKVRVWSPILVEVPWTRLITADSVRSTRPKVCDNRLTLLPSEMPRCMSKLLVFKVLVRCIRLFSGVSPSCSN